MICQLGTNIIEHPLILAEDPPATNDGDKPAPTPAPAPPCPDLPKEAVRMNLSNASVARADGRNFLQYRTIARSVLQSLPQAHEVVNRTLLPGVAGEQKRCCRFGKQERPSVPCYNGGAVILN